MKPELIDSLGKELYEQKFGFEIEATARAFALRDGGHLHVQRGRCSLRSRRTPLDKLVPPTVEGTVAMRIDRLRRTLTVSPPHLSDTGGSETTFSICVRILRTMGAVARDPWRPNLRA